MAVPTPATGFPMTGVAYVGQIEHEYMSLHKLSVCSNCLALGFQKPLKRCNGCKLVDYCSKECQKSHWSRHKAFCTMVQGKGPKNAYLSRLRTADGVIRVLIDAYRLRTELDHAHRKENHGKYYDGTTHDLVWANGDAEDDFQRWLDLVEQAGILPEWWKFENRMECLAEAVDRKSESNIFGEFDQEGLVTKYEGDLSIRSALNILAELVVGYEGKGRAEDGTWFKEFQEWLDLHPDEKARLIQGSVEAVKNAGILPESSAFQE